MENGLKEGEAIGDGILTENNESNPVATIYCNASKLFESSRSSVKTRLVDQCSLNFSGLAQPNFCELDIIARNEKVNTVIKFSPLQTTPKLKGVPVVIQIPQGSRIFKSTIENLDENVNKSSSTMLSKEVFKQCDSVSDGALETNANVRNKVKKYGRRKSKKSAGKHKRERTLENNDNVNHCTNFIDNNEIVQKYDNLVNAKTMYFVDLPNKMDVAKKKKKKSDLGTETEKDAVDDERKIRKNVDEKESKNLITEKMKIDCNSKSIIINKIENDVPQLNSVYSQSSLGTTKKRTVSDISVNWSVYSNKKWSSDRIHNNSPTSDVTIQEIIVKPDKHNHKRKQKERHQNSKQTSTDEELKIRIEDVNKATKERKSKPSSKRKPSSEGNVEKKSQKSGKISSEIENDKQVLNVSNLNIQQKKIEKEELKANINKINRKSINRKHSKKQSFVKQVIPQQKTSGNEPLQNILKEEKNSLEQDNKMKVILKHKTKEHRQQEIEGKRHLKRRNNSLITSRAKNNKLEATSIVSRNENKKTTSKERAINNKEANTTQKNGADFVDGKEKTENLRPAKLQPIVLLKDAENNQSKNSSVLKLYFVEQLAPSTSSLKLTDDLLLQLKTEQKKHTSLRSRSKQRHSVWPATNDQIKKQERRSKSRVTKEEVRKSRTRHASKADIERQGSRKSASDVSNRRYVGNFDISPSVEGKLDSMKQKEVELSSKSEKINRFKAHTKKSKASVSLSTTTFDNNWSKLPEKDSYWKEGISTFTEKISRKTVRKENRKWSKSCTRKEYEFVCQYSEEESKTKSDTSANRRHPESERSKSLVSKVRTRTALANQTVIAQSSEDKVYQELCKLGTYQNRIRVISKPIRNKDSSTTNNNNESSALFVKNHRLKPHPSSEKEKEAILNLFRQSNMSASSTKNVNVSGTKLQPDMVRKKRSQIRMRDKYSPSTSEEETLRSLSDKTPRRKKRIKKRLFRREVSFTHLNVTPVQELYRKRSSISVTKTKLPPEVLFANKLCKPQETHSALFRRNVEDKASENKECEKKLSYFHITPGEKILEISTKATTKDGNTSIGFTVSGTEPPKRLGNHNVEKVASAKSCKLHMTFLPPVEITENFGFENEVPALNYCAETKKEDSVCCSTTAKVKVNKDDIIKVIKEMPLTFVPSSHLKRKKTSTLVTYRGVSKLHSYRKNNIHSLWKKRIPKLVHATKAEKINSFKRYETPPIKVEGKKEEVKKKQDNTKSCFNTLKLCCSRQTTSKNKPAKTLSLLESALQVIKEESHSTDSSRCRNRATEKANVTTDIKNTQTDFESSEDIIKMKKVLSYLCSTIEQIKNLDGRTEIKTAEKYLQTEKCLDSSTETSSYEERFGEARKNEKLNQFKKIIKLSNQEMNEASKSKSIQDIRAEAVKECNKLSPSTTDSSSCASSTSNPKSLSPEQSSSGEAHSLGYFQMYKAKKALIDPIKKAEMESTSDKAVLTSVEPTFESTNTTVINVKVDKSIGTTEDEVVLVNQEQSTSENQSNFIEDAAKNDCKILSSVAPTLKKFEDKALQTTDYINAMVQVESNSQTNATLNCLHVEKNFSNSTNSDNNAVVEKIFKTPEEKEKKKTLQKPSSTFERIKRVFNTKEQKYIKNEVMTYNVSEKFDSEGKIVSGQQLPEMNYTNFIKFERHLEQVLGLYPSIFKAIRSQMDFAFAKTIVGKPKEKNFDSFQSRTTLATTIDTVTEYKNTECFEKEPSSTSNEHCCNCYHVWHKKCIVQQYTNSQDFVDLKSRKHSEHIKQRKAYRRKIEEHRANKGDSTSSMKREAPKRLKKHRARQSRKRNFKETCGFNSITSVYSNDGFISSCSSISLNEKWSVESPLYGRSTPSQDLSAVQQNIKEENVPASSQSLKVNKITIPCKRRKSKSLIEVSTKKSLNRKLILKQLLNASVHKQNNPTQVLSDERQPNVLLLSVSSSCTVFTTPSDFLSKVEKHLQNEKAPPPLELTSRAVGEDLVNENVLPKPKPKVDEKLYRKLLFPNAAKHLKVNSIPKANRQKPFYFHQPSEDNSELELDSLEISSLQTKDEEDDFSADSLEVIKSPPKSYNYNMLYTSMTFVKPANQTYLVYSNTVQYDKKLSKRTERDRYNSKHHKTADEDKKRSTSFSNQNQNVSNTSESGYESTKSKRTESIRNFFKKGGSLLDMFRSSNKAAAKPLKNIENQNLSNFTSFSSLDVKKEGTQNVQKRDVGTSFTKDKSSGPDKDKVYWHSTSKDKKVGKHENKTTKAGQTDRESDTRSKRPEIKLFPASSSLSYKKQRNECHAYAEKVLLESQLRREGYYKQYRDFKEMPLELLIGKKMPTRSKFKHQESFAQTNPMSIQAEVNIRENKAPHSSAKYNAVYDLETDENSAPKIYVTDEKIVLQSDITKTTPAVNPKELKKDVIPLNLRSSSKKEVCLKNLEEKKSLPLLRKLLSRVIITRSKTDVEGFDKSKLCSNNFKDPVNDVDSILTSSTRISDDLNSKASVESSDEFHELYINSSGFRNNPVDLPELTQFTLSKSKIVEDFKAKASEESFGLSANMTQNETETTQSRSKSRSKTSEGTKLDKSRSDKLLISDREHQNIAELGETTLKSKLDVSGNSDLRNAEQSCSGRSELYTDETGHQKSTENILETIDFNVKSREGSQRNSREDLEASKAFEVLPVALEQQETTVIVVEVPQFSLKSRSNTPKDAKSKSSSKTRHKSKTNSKSTSTKRSKHTPEKIKHKCHCKEETLDLTEEKQPTQESVDEESDTLQSIPNVPSKEDVSEIQLKQAVDEEPSNPNLIHTEEIPKAQEAVEVEDTDTLQSEPIVSSIIDVIVSNSVTEDIKKEDDFKPEIDENENAEAAVAEIPHETPRNVSDDFRKGLTDKEVFEKLLESYEKKDTIAVRLSKDDDFFNSQIDSLRNQSEESFGEQSKWTGRDSKVYADQHRSPRFWEEKIRQMRSKEDNPVKADDIGICFARGFRPDNITLSGDACFNLNKQDQLGFSEKMLSDEESIIDFSERETPLDYLLALGFMVDEASNALKDEDIRSRLLAAITEARVWVNKITTTQGTLLYLVAYKSRPKTMRYFLQLVEAIINRRINNAIKLDGFLRILEQVEEGEIQMINILGAEKFEDEESEEKIVRKQLKQLFITVYKIAERESFQRGKQLSEESIFLLRILAAKYRAGLHPHLELIARYIGQELLTTEIQLEAAMIFLSRLDTAEVKLKEFEAYCDIKCEKGKKTERKLESTSIEKSKKKK